VNARRSGVCGVQAAVRVPVPERAELPYVKVVTGSGISRSGRELGRAATRRVERSCLARGHVSATVTAACNDVEAGVVSGAVSGEAMGGYSRRWRWSEKGDSCRRSDAGEVRERGRTAPQ
jgi:hypothetical protein